MRNFIHICKLPNLIIVFFIISGNLFNVLAESKPESFLLPDSLKNEVGFQSVYLSNKDSTVHLKIQAFPGDSKLIINKIVWDNYDSIYNTLEPVNLVLNPRDAHFRKIYWEFGVDFPHAAYFDDLGKIIFYTNKGKFRLRVVRLPNVPRREKKIVTEELNNEALQKKLEESKKLNNRLEILWIVFLNISIVLFFSLIAVWRHFQLSKNKSEQELKNINNKLEESIRQLAKGEKQIDELYYAKFDTFNYLCDEFYEKNGSDNLRLTLFNNVKELIMSYTDKKKIEELQDFINTYQHNIINNIKTLFPELQKSDIIFLTYIFCGFSPKAISVLTEINIKQFYYRRNKIKDMILASDVAEKKFFVSKIQSF